MSEILTKLSYFLLFKNGRKENKTAMRESGDAKH